MDKWAEVRKAIEELSSQEAKLILVRMLLPLKTDESNEEAESKWYRSAKELYEELLVSRNGKSQWEPNADTAKVHLVFGDSIAGSLKLCIRRQGDAETNKVIVVRDSFAIGPLWQLHEKAGRAQRAEWFRDRMNDGGDPDDVAEDDSDYRKLTGQIANIPAGASVVIWSGKNAHEQVGLRYAAYLLRDRRNDVFVFDAADVCEKRFNRADRRIDYLHAGEVPTDKLQTVLGETEHNRPLTGETRRKLEQEWLSLAERHEALRIWDGERIVNVDERHFDAYLLETVEKLHAYRSNRDFIKAARVIGEAIGYCNQYVGDSFFEYRLRELIYNGALEIRGIPRGMRYYSVRRKKPDPSSS
ncbi:DUF1835 domain-containing protein [Paenibacillus flagellatus]|uniref:DUF1835 domain-containing protein n=1 Tax=Paenibacillus flagellatus TaxID=2211139 RepID=A0A2V5KBP6_9BACL|nr:DUF1835 domain-containing protein [Paenibacillus flagellatus]PYI55564.1 hypothetical protein DLM86_07475 [Paenibacillus flagellatus]